MSTRSLLLSKYGNEPVPNNALIYYWHIYQKKPMHKVRIALHYSVVLLLYTYTTFFFTLCYNYLQLKPVQNRTAISGTVSLLHQIILIGLPKQWILYENLAILKRQVSAQIHNIEITGQVRVRLVQQGFRTTKEEKLVVFIDIKKCVSASHERIYQKRRLLRHRPKTSKKRHFGVGGCCLIFILFCYQLLPSPPPT